MSPYTGGPSRWRRLAAWLAEPAPGSEAGRRLARARAVQAARDAHARAEQARRDARVEDVRVRYADPSRSSHCQRVRDAGRCVPTDQQPADMPADIPADPVVPHRVPDYLVELVRHADGTYRRPA